MLSVPWLNPKAVSEARSMLIAWPSIPAVDALELLDAHFPDSEVR